MGGNAFWLGRTRLVDDKGYPTKQAHLFLAGLNAKAGYSSISVSNGTAYLDLGGGINQQLTLVDASITNFAIPKDSASGISTGDTFSLYVDQDATGGWPMPTFPSGPGGFASDVNLQDPITTPNTRTTYLFTFHGTLWGLDSFRTNGAIS